MKDNVVLSFKTIILILTDGDLNLHIQIRNSHQFHALNDFSNRGKEHLFNSKKSVSGEKI